MADQIDFKALADAALARAETLLGQWLPDGHKVGFEWKSRNPVRDDRKEGSFSINCSTGAWADFADDDAKGGDLVSLYAYLFCDGKMGDAAWALADMLGMPEAIPEYKPGEHKRAQPASAPEKKPEAGRCCRCRWMRRRRPPRMNSGGFPSRCGPIATRPAPCSAMSRAL